LEWLLSLDERVFLALNGDGSAGLDLFFSIITYLGHAAGLVPVVLGTMALRDRARLREHGLAMVLAVAVGALAVEGLKSLVGRPRPALHFESLGAARVRMPAVQLRTRSFPSGHAQASAGAATYVSLLYPGLTALAALGAILCGLSRIYLGVHFPSDVIAGALCGVLFSLAGFRLRRWLARADDR
jgi:undecaprenyl-diphosphatase